MGILKKLSTETFRVFEWLGGNEAVPEYFQRTPTDVRRNKKEKFELFAYLPFPIAPVVGFLTAFVAISARWLWELPTDAGLWAYEVDQVDRKKKPIEAEGGDGDVEAAQDKKKKSKAGILFGERLLHYVLGIPSLAISVPLALISLVVVSTFFQWPKQMVISGAQVIKNMWQLAWGDERSTFQEINRHWFLKGIGIPGGVIGFGLIIVPALLVVAGRIASEAYKVLYAIPSFFKMIATVFHEVSTEDSIFNNPRIYDEHRYGWGLPGTIAGFVTGVVLASPIILTRVITNTIKAYYHSIKVAINWGFQREIFNDSYLDNVSKRNATFSLRTWASFTSNAANLKWGFLAAIPAALTSLPAALVIRGFRVLGPIVIGALFVIIPLAPLRRMGDETIKFFRGQLLDPSKQGAIDDIDYAVHRRIFANIDPWSGKVDENLPTIPGKPGYSQVGGGFWQNVITPKNWAKFIRKSFTFNGQTLQESFLSKMYGTLAESNDTALERIRDARDLLKESINEQEETAASLAKDIEDIRRGNSGVKIKLWLPRKESKLEKITNSIEGLQEEVSLLNREELIRTSPLAPNDRTAALITLTVDQMKLSYKDQSTITMSPLEKDANDRTLDNLGDFVIEKLREGAAQNSTWKPQGPPPAYQPQEWEAEPIHAELPGFLFKYRTPSAPLAHEVKLHEVDVDDDELGLGKTFS